MGRINILGLDPGFASLGYAVVSLSSDFTREVFYRDERPLMGIWETEKSDKKRAVRASDDNLRRTRELVKELLMLLGSGLDIKVVCAEAMSFPRSSSAAQKVGICWGIIGTMVEMMNLPVVQSSPQEIKKKICGKKDASKSEIQVALAGQYRLDLDSFQRSTREHCFDALGAAETAIDSEVIRLACRMAS